jgi:hypothetical protein
MIAAAAAWRAAFRIADAVPENALSTLARMEVVTCPRGMYSF